jgi:hypothetical protein
MRTLILVGVIVFVVAAFVGLVWLFVKISSSPEARAREAELQAKSGPPLPSFGRRAEPTVVARAGPSQTAGTGAAGRKKQGKKAKGRKAR